MPNDPQKLAAACGLLARGEHRCTAYLIDRDWAATCAHFAVALGIGQTVVMSFPGRRVVKAKITDFDVLADCALLKLDTPIEDVQTLPLAREFNPCRPTASWNALGFPVAAGDEGLDIHGTVIAPDRVNDDGVHSIVLYSDQIAAGSGARPDGLSGAPVMVRGKVIEHVKKKVPRESADDPQDKGRAEWGVLFACPSEYVRGMLRKHRPQHGKRVSGRLAAWIAAALVILLGITGWMVSDHAEGEREIDEPAERFQAAATVSADESDFLSALWYTVLSIEAERAASESNRLRLAYYARQVPQLRALAVLDEQAAAAAFLDAASGHDILTVGQSGTIARWRLSGDDARMRRLSRAAREERSVDDLVVSPDGQFAVLTSHTNTACLWDLRGEEPQCRTLQHDAIISAVGIAARAPVVVTGSRDGTARVWNAADGEPVAILEHGDNVQCVDLSPDGRLAATGGLDDMVRVWDVNAVSERGKFRPADADDVVAARFVLNGRALFSAAVNGAMEIRQFPNVLKAEHYVQQPGTLLRAVCDANGRRAAALTEDKKLYLWDLVRHQGLELAQYPDQVNCLRLSADGRYACVAVERDFAEIHDVSSFDERARFKLAHPEAVVDVRLSDDNRRIITVCKDRAVRVWSLVRPELLRLENASHPRSGVFSQEGRKLIARDSQALLHVWRWKPIDSGEDARENWQPEALGWDVPDVLSFSVGGPSGNLLLVACEDRTVRVKDLEKPARKSWLFEHEDRVAAATISPDGRHVVSATRGAVRLWSLGNSYAPAAVLEDDSGRTAAEIAFQHGTMRVAIRYVGASVELIDLGKPSEDPVRIPGEERALGVQFSPERDSPFLLIHRGGKRVEIWDASKRDPTRPVALLSQEDFIEFAGFSPDGQFVMTGSEDGGVLLWDWKLQRVLFRFQASQAGLHSANISPDGRWLMVLGERYGWVLPWFRFEKLATGDLRTWAKRLTGAEMRTDSPGEMRALGHEEWLALPDVQRDEQESE